MENPKEEKLKMIHSLMVEYVTKYPDFNLCEIVYLLNKSFNILINIDTIINDIKRELKYSRRP